jgi:hypothetical protein
MTNKVFDLIKGLGEREFNAKETMQLLASSGPIYWSWGVSSRSSIDSKALVLKVNGNHHKGYVVITLAWNDTYTVNIITTHGNILDTYTEVYFDMLAEIIDNRIERTANYIQ